MKRLTAFAAVTILGLALSAPGAALADETTAPDEAPSSETAETPISPYVGPSIVYVSVVYSGYVYDTDSGYKDYLRNGNGTIKRFDLGYRCTGFVVNPDGWIATAGHCVDSKAADLKKDFDNVASAWAVRNDPDYAHLSLATVKKYAYLFRVDGISEGRVVKGRPERAVEAAWSVSAGGVETGEVYPALVKKYQSFGRGDAAILKIDKTELSAIELNDETTDLEPQTAVVSVGYPGSVDTVTDPSLESPSFTDGSISSERQIQQGLLTVYAISAQVSGGMSGGPTVDLDGRVIGINSFGIDPRIETQSFNFIRPTTNLNDLMSDVGVENELSETTQTYNAGLDAYFAGDKEAAVEALETVTEDQPTHQMAAEYLNRANDLPDAEVAADESDSSGFPLLAIAIGAGLVLLLALGGVVLITRRRGGSGGSGTAANPAGPPPSSAGNWAPQSTPATPTSAMPMAPVPAQGPQEAAPPSALAVQQAPDGTAEQVGFTTAGAESRAAGDQHVEPGVTHQAAAFCTSCGTRSTGQQHFCGNCGAAL